MLGQNIKRIRAAKKLTQEQVAEMAGLDVRSLQRIESGKTEPRAANQSALAAALGVSVQSLKEDPYQRISAKLDQAFGIGTGERVVTGFSNIRGADDINFIEYLERFVDDHQTAAESGKLVEISEVTNGAHLVSMLAQSFAMVPSYAPDLSGEALTTTLELKEMCEGVLWIGSDLDVEATVRLGEDFDRTLASLSGDDLIVFFRLHVTMITSKSGTTNWPVAYVNVLRRYDPAVQFWSSLLGRYAMWVEPPGMLRRAVS